MSTTSTSLAALAALCMVGPALAAPQDPTTSIKRDTDPARTLAEPSYQTREQRLTAKPLDWNATTGKPRRKAQTAAEKKALAGAKPEHAEGGAPDPKADEEARRLHPDDWKAPEQQQR
jgi:hypothetical protein